jgi:ParB/RepB/Spo0J family partition protein
MSEISKMDFMPVRVSDLYVDYTTNSRGSIDKESADELALSIQQHGLINPITIKLSDPSQTDKPYTLVAGFTRFYACSTLLGWTMIPATITESDAYIIMSEENLKRSNLTIYQEAIWLRRWAQEQNLTYRQIGAKLGKSVAWIQARLKLLELDPETQKLAENNQITAKDIIEKWREKTGGGGKHETYAKPIVSAPAKKTKRVRLNYEVQDIVRKLVERGEAGSPVVIALNWAIGDMDDSDLNAAIGPIEII